MFLNLNDKLPDIVAALNILEGQRYVLLSRVIGPDNQSTCSGRQHRLWSNAPKRVRTLLAVVLLLLGHTRI